MPPFWGEGAESPSNTMSLQHKQHFYLDVSVSITDRPSSEEVCSIPLPVLVTIVMRRGKKSTRERNLQEIIYFSESGLCLPSTKHYILPHCPPNGEEIKFQKSHFGPMYTGYRDNKFCIQTQNVKNGFWLTFPLYR